MLDRNIFNKGYQNILGIRGGGGIKSIQPVGGQITNGNSTATITLSTAVDPDNTILIGSQGTRAGIVAFPQDVCRWELTSTTEITLTSTTAAGGTDGAIVSILALEFQPDIILSQQYVSIAASAGSTSVTTSITSVDTNYSYPFASGLVCATTPTGSNMDGVADWAFDLPNATTARARINASGTTALTYTLYANVVEFNSV